MSFDNRCLQSFSMCSFQGTNDNSFESALRFVRFAYSSRIFKEYPLIKGKRLLWINSQSLFHLIIQCFLNYQMEIRRFELLTPCLQGRCSPNWATPPCIHFSSFSSCDASRPSPWKLNNMTCLFNYSLERRWSSRTFRYGYLVTTSPQSSIPPSTAPSLRLGYRLRVLPTLMVWRAVCTRPGNVFTATFWFAITSDSSFM